MRSIPEDNFAYPSLIVLSNGSSGSGFLLKTETNMFFVTAKHVLFDNKGNLDDLLVKFMKMPPKLMFSKKFSMIGGNDNHGSIIDV